MAEMESNVAGIPCLIRVTDYSHQAPHRGSAHTCDSDLDYYGYEDIDFEILDRRGYKADWLARKLTPKDDERIRTEISEFMKEEACA